MHEQPAVVRAPSSGSMSGDGTDMRVVLVDVAAAGLPFDADDAQPGWRCGRRALSLPGAPPTLSCLRNTGC
jgi:hypothetical protein